MSRQIKFGMSLSLYFHIFLQFYCEIELRINQVP